MDKLKPQIAGILTNVEKVIQDKIFDLKYDNACMGNKKPLIGLESLECRNMVTGEVVDCYDNESFLRLMEIKMGVIKNG